MRALIIGLGVLLILILGALFVVPSLVPSETYRARIQEQLSTELGREVELSGDVSLSTFPGIRARTGGVRVANPEGFGSADLATLQGLEAKIRLLPLLSRRVEIKSFTLREPVITLERREDGQVNWEFAQSEGAVDAPDPGPFRRDGRYTDIDPSISAFNIENGTMRFIDRVSGRDVTVDRIDSFLSLPGLGRTLVVDGSVRVEGRPLTLDIAMDNPEAFLSGQAASLTGDIETDGARAEVDGVFPAGEALAFRGKVNGQVSDVAGLRAALGDLVPDQPALSALSRAAVAGTVSYAGDDYALESGYVELEGPALSARFDGSARYNGAPVLDGRLEAQVSDAQALADLLPEPVPGFELLRTASVRADLGADGTDAFTLRNVDAKAAGDGFAADFAGAGRYADALSLDGTFNARADDPARLARLVAPDVKGAGVLGATEASGRLAMAGPDITVTELEATTQGERLQASYKGRAAMRADTVTAEGAFSASIPDAAALLAASGLELDPGLVADAAAAGAVEAAGLLDYDGKTAVITNIDATTRSEVQSARYQGELRYSDTAALRGRLEAEVPSLPALAARLSTRIANSGAVNRISVAVDLSGPQDALRLDNIEARLSDGPLNGRYAGSAVLGEVPALNGRFEAEVPDLSSLDAAVEPAIPYSEAVGRIVASGTMAGSVDDLAVTDLSAAMTDGLLNGQYSGTAGLSGEAMRLDGQLSVSGDSLRRVAALGGTALPPSTELGPVFERFGLAGRVGGTAEAIQLSDARLRLDAMTGAGRFNLDMTGAKPRLTGNLDVGDVDFRPYMDAYSAQNPTGKIQPWSREPLPVEPLRAVDAELDLKASSVKVTRLTLGPTTMKVRLADGRLTGDLPALALYGGKGRASFAYDASQAVPRVELSAALDTLDNKGFLSALAGFAKATGTAGTTVDIKGAGRTQAEIMQSLSGGGDYKLVNGEIAGIDAGQFLTGLETALRSRALPSGIGPGQSTKFRDLLGAFSVKDGVASVERFSLDALGVSAEGSGQIDLGAQTLDFRFRPKATGDNARGLAAFGVPIRFSGGFGSAKAGLDAEFLGEIAAAKAREEAGRVVSDRIGGPVGGILGGVIGGGAKTPDPAPSPAPQPDGQASPAPSAPAPATDAVSGIVGGLLGSGGRKTAPEPAPQTAPDAPQPAPAPDTEAAQPETVEDAVLGLFGVKRRKPETKPAPTDD